MSSVTSIGRGGTGKAQFSPNCVIMSGGTGKEFIEITLEQLATMLGNQGSPNISPTVDAGNNQTVTVNSITLTGTAQDPDGSITARQWNKIAGPTEVVGSGFIPSTWTPNPARTFVLTPSGNGDLVINGANYQAGDLIVLDGTFRSVTVNNMVGASGNPIVIRNPTGKITTVGNPVWAADGTPSYAIQFNNSRYFVLGGTSYTNFIIDGCNNMTIPGGESQPYKTAYRNLSFDEKTEFFQVVQMTVNNGGTSIVAKTEPIAGDSSTWWNGSNYLGYMYFDSIIVQDCFNEAFYIGHTSQYWDIVAQPNAPIYPGPYAPAPDSNRYKQARKIHDVKIRNCIIRRAGQDALQIAAVVEADIYQNEVYNWAIKEDGNHNGGILIGGRSELFNVHDNIFHDSWGQILQFLGQGPGHVFHNNLCYNVDGANAAGDMASFAGATGDNITQINPAQITVTNNTFVRNGPGGSLLRVNGQYNKGSVESPGLSGPDNLQVITKNNILAAPKNNAAQENIDPFYIYTENPMDYDYNTIVTKENNVQYLTLASANLNTSNFYQPNSGAVTQGYRHITNTGPVNITTGSQILSPNNLVTEVTGLMNGVYTFSLTVTDNRGASATSTTQVTVNLT